MRSENCLCLRGMGPKQSAVIRGVKRFVAVLLCGSVSLLCAAETRANYYSVTYDGGSIAGAKTGAGMKLFIDGEQIKITNEKKEIATIPAAAVTEISYGQDVHRRVGAAVGLAFVSFGIGGLMALTKSKKHFIGLTWDDAGKKGGIAFQADKSEYRGVLAGLEGITGKKAVDSDTMTVKN
jgi:hypothetical protein